MQHMVSRAAAWIGRGWLAYGLAATALLSACGGGGGGGSSDPSFSVSSQQVSFTAVAGGTTPQAQSVSVNVSGGTVYLSTSQSGNGFGHSLQLSGGATATVLITPAAPQAAGTTTGIIQIYGCRTSNCAPGSGSVGGSPQTIQVTYTVQPAPPMASMPASLAFTTTPGVTPAPATLGISISAPSAAWTSSIAYTGAATGWLSVSPASAGTLPATATVTPSVSNVPNGRHTANITFRSAGSSVTVPVTMTVMDAGAKFVSPYVANTSVGGNVIIRGHGFDSVASGLQVRFGSVNASSATLVSSTEIHATHPGLPAGSHAVTVGNAAQTLPTRANLVVVPVATYAAAAIDRNAVQPSYASRLIHDPERQAVYLLDTEQNRLEAYRYNGTAWIPGTPVVVGSTGVNPAMALSPDGQELVKGGGALLHRLDPATFNVLGTAELPSAGLYQNRSNMMAFANDGALIGNASPPAGGPTLYRYDMLTRQFTTLSTDEAMPAREIAASGDGSRLMLPSYDSLVPAYAQPIVTYSSGSSGDFTTHTTRSSGSSPVSVNRNGTRSIFQTILGGHLDSTRFVVYGADMAPIGQLPDTDNRDCRAVTISPDGRYAYAYYSNTGLVRKFDLNAPSSGSFAEVGTGTTPIASPGTGLIYSILVSADGRTLFLAGNQRLIVMPAP